MSQPPPPLNGQPPNSLPVAVQLESPPSNIAQNELKIPWTLLVVLFAIIPTLGFILIGVVEDSFTLQNNGFSIDESGEHWPILELGDAYYLIDDAPLTPNHNISKYDLNEMNDIKTVVFENGSIGLRLSSDYTDQLARCPSGTIVESCIITNNGILEDPIFLGYFPAAALTVIAGKGLVSGFHRIIETTSSRLVMLKGEDGGDSQLTEEDRAQLTLFQQLLISSLLPWNKSPQMQFLTPENVAKIRWVRRIPWIISIFGFLFLVMGTLQHWNSVDTYGFDIWASQNYLLGFMARLLYEAILYLIFFPMMFYWLFCSIYLKHQTLIQLEQKRGFRFIRFSHDEAGGMGEFGSQSLRNVVVMLPLLLPIIAYIIFYPVTPILIIGLSGFLIGLPILFLWPLLGARRSMIRMKELEIQTLATHFERSYFQHKRAVQESPEDLELHGLTGEALQRSEQIYQEMSNLPTWPFSRTLLTKFASIITTVTGSIFFIIGG